MNETEEHRNFVTIALTKISTDVKHVKKTVERNQKWLAQLNGRVRRSENTISWIKGIGITVTFVISTIIGFLMRQ